MLTKNFYNAFAYEMTNNGSPLVVLTNYAGNPISVNTNSLNYGSLANAINDITFLKKAKSTSPGTGVAFGTGDAVESLGDYHLSGDCLTKYTASYERKYSTDDNGTKATYLITITNTGEETVTIREIGVFQGSSTNCCLLERSVLSNPVTIEAGGAGQVVYTLNFPYPT